MRTVICLSDAAQSRCHPCPVTVNPPTGVRTSLLLFTLKSNPTVTGCFRMVCILTNFRPTAAFDRVALNRARGRFEPSRGQSPRSHALPCLSPGAAPHSFPRSSVGMPFGTLCVLLCWPGGAVSRRRGASQTAFPRRSVGTRIFACNMQEWKTAVSETSPICARLFRGQNPRSHALPCLSPRAAPHSFSRSCSVGMPFGTLCVLLCASKGAEIGRRGAPQTAFPRGA